MGSEDHSARHLLRSGPLLARPLRQGCLLNPAAARTRRVGSSVWHGMHRSAATCSPFSHIPMRRPIIMAVNENCGRQLPIERSPAGFDPTGALIYSPMSDPSSALPRDTASFAIAFAKTPAVLIDGSQS